MMQIFDAWQISIKIAMCYFVSNYLIYVHAKYYLKWFSVSWESYHINNVNFFDKQCIYEISYDHSSSKYDCTEVVKKSTCTRCSQCGSRYFVRGRSKTFHGQVVLDRRCNASNECAMDDEILSL